MQTKFVLYHPGSDSYLSNSDYVKYLRTDPSKEPSYSDAFYNYLISNSDDTTKFVTLEEASKKLYEVIKKCAFLILEKNKKIVINPLHLEVREFYNSGGIQIQNNDEARNQKFMASWNDWLEHLSKLTGISNLKSFWSEAEKCGQEKIPFKTGQSVIVSKTKRTGKISVGVDNWKYTTLCPSPSYYVKYDDEKSLLPIGVAHYHYELEKI